MAFLQGIRCRKYCCCREESKHSLEIWMLIFIYKKIWKKPNPYMYFDYSIFFRKRWEHIIRKIFPLSYLLRSHSNLGQVGGIWHPTDGQKGFFCPGVQRSQSRASLGFVQSKVCGNVHSDRFYSNSSYVLQVQ